MGSPELARRLGRGLLSRLPSSFKEDLLGCAATVLRAAGDADVVFVGRSPESIYDFLRGALSRTSLGDRVRLVQLSLRDGPRELRRELPDAFGHLRSYLDALGLTPARILARPRPVAFVDLVWSGATFRNLAAVLRHLAGGEPRDWIAARERLRWVCLVPRGDPDGPGSWEPRDSTWNRELHGGRVRREAIDWRLWHYLGDDQPKTTESYDAEAWGHAPPACALEDERLEAVLMARAAFRLGQCWRRRLAGRLEAAEPWRGALARAPEAPRQTGRFAPCCRLRQPSLRLRLSAQRDPVSGAGCGAE